MKEQYLSYSSVQFASDESFIAWVMHGAQAREWEQWLKAHPHIQDYTKEARRIIEDLEANLSIEKLSDAEQKNLWNKITADITEKPEAANGLKVNFIRWISIAAAAIALLVWFNVRNHTTTVIAQAGEKQNFELPDQSHVVLNAGSTLEYDKKNFTKDRHLQLKGEAFFEVMHGSSFSVQTDGGVVKVLGTKFNVLSRGNRFEVSCLQGKVGVENEFSEQAIIEKGMKCATNAKTKKLDTRVVAVELDVPEWTRGKFVFENQTLKTVVEELERQYNIKIVLAPGLEDVPYSGFFESGNLDQALSLITWPLHLQAQKNGNTVSIAR
jgi:ferric-dicitrate binding protein FerR (iron transport regulator)